VPYRCKSWDCPECRLIKVKTVQSVIHRSFKDEQVTFLTITDLHKTTAQEAWASFGKRWNHLRIMLEREYGKFSYIRILEPHKGEPFPHSHVLVNIPVTKIKLQEFCRRAGFGWQADAREMDTHNACTYISKYMTKDWPENGANALRKLTRCRIVQASHDIGAIFAKVSDWTLEKSLGNKPMMKMLMKDFCYRIMCRTTAKTEIKNGSYGVELSYRPENYILAPFNHTGEDLPHYEKQRKHHILLKIIDQVIESEYCWTDDSKGNPQNPEEEEFPPPENYTLFPNGIDQPIFQEFDNSIFDRLHPIIEKMECPIEYIQDCYESRKEISVEELDQFELSF
jgi:hypothetical protein